MEKTFIALKPDAIQRGFVGEIISRFERKGFKLIGMKMMMVTQSMAKEHYGEHKGKPFFDGLVNFITSSPIVAMAWEGDNVVSAARLMMGATNPKDAQPGTIRGDFAVDMGRNIIHGSDSVASAERELGIFFDPNELLAGWLCQSDCWVYENIKAPAVV
ncbi:MAG: nucleoside-diphosphate kinase [Cyanobacteria bacterium P01_H01_bin.74]